MSEQTSGQPGASGVQEETRAAEGQVEIDTTAERVWNALTEAGELTRWFPLDARVEPGAGGTLYMSWLNEFAATMDIQVWDPPRHLRTAWSFHEEGPSQVTDYYIETKGGRTVVRAVTSGFPMDSSWDGWVEGTTRGWAFELRSLKHYLERHTGEPRHVLYLRRRIPISTEEAWLRVTGEPELAPWLIGGQPFDRQPASQYAAVVNDPASPGSGSNFAPRCRSRVPGRRLQEFHRERRIHRLARARAGQRKLLPARLLGRAARAIGRTGLQGKVVLMVVDGGMTAATR